jgi:hypothetical protein
VTFDHCDTWRDGLLRAHAVSQPTEVRCIDPATGEVLEEILLDARAALLGDERALYTDGESAGRCVDLRDRSVAWQRPVFDVAREAAGIPLDPRTHPLASFHGPDTVVVQYGPGLAAFRAATGETLWTARLPAAPHSSVAVALGCAVASTRRRRSPSTWRADGSDGFAPSGRLQPTASRSRPLRRGRRFRGCS